MQGRAESRMSVDPQLGYFHGSSFILLGRSNSWVARLNTCILVGRRAREFQTRKVE